MKPTYKIKVFHDDMNNSPFDYEGSRLKLWAWGTAPRGLYASDGTSPGCPDVHTWGDAFYELVLAANAEPARIWPVYEKDDFVLMPGPNASLAGYVWTSDTTVTREDVQAALTLYNAWYRGDMCEYVIKLLDDAEDDIGTRVAADVGFLSNKLAVDAALVRLADVAPVGGYDVIIEDLSVE